MDLESMRLGERTHTTHLLLGSIYIKPKNRNRRICRTQVDNNLELGTLTEPWLLMHGLVSF